MYIIKNLFFIQFLIEVNLFLIKKVLENHHVSQTYLILSNSKYNILENVSEQDYKLIRKRMISNILHTDIKKHFDLIKDFEFQLKDSNEVANLNDPSN